MQLYKSKHILDSITNSENLLKIIAFREIKMNKNLTVLAQLQSVQLKFYYIIKLIAHFWITYLFCSFLTMMGKKKYVIDKLN